MKALKVIGIILLVLVIIGAALHFTSPKEYSVSRSKAINASTETVFKNISTFEAFNKWNPWNKYDTAAIVTLEGTDGAVGAKRSWKGNDKMGEGSMTITKIEPNKAVEYELVFLKPFESHNSVRMEVTPGDSGQTVTWSMHGPVHFPMSIMRVAMNMDKMIGPDFEAGLNNLETMSESNTAGGTTYKIEDADWTEKTALSVRKTVKFSDMKDFFGKHYPAMFTAVTAAGAKPGIPLGVFYMYDETKMEADVAAALPYEGKEVKAAGYTTLKLPATKAHVIHYYGDYNNMKPAYDEMTAYLKTTYNRENPDMVVEEYITDPMSEKDTAKWQTNIYFFVDKKTATAAQ